MVQVLEHLEAHYEVHDVEMGKVYRWCPERAVVECDCGETFTLAASASTCGNCGKDHALLIEEVLAPHLAYSGALLRAFQWHLEKKKRQHR